MAQYVQALLMRWLPDPQSLSLWQADETELPSRGQTGLLAHTPPTHSKTLSGPPHSLSSVQSRPSGVVGQGELKVAGAAPGRQAGDAERVQPGHGGPWPPSTAQAMAAAEHGGGQVTAASILKEGEPLRDPVLFHKDILAIPKHVGYAGDKKGLWRRDNIDKVITQAALFMVWQLSETDKRKTRGRKRSVPIDTLPDGPCDPALCAFEWRLMRKILSNRKQAKVNV
jgi:hypothetical protein